MAIIDPIEALNSFQTEYNAGRVKVKPCEFHKEIFVNSDNPKGTIRLTYIRLDRDQITAMAILVDAKPVDGEICFSLAYATPKKHRNLGLATATSIAAIEELSHGLSKHGIKSIHVEAVIGKDNIASQHVAMKVLTPFGEDATDSHSGDAAVHYIRRISANDTSDLVIPDMSLLVSTANEHTAFNRVYEELSPINFGDVKGVIQKIGFQPAVRFYTHLVRLKIPDSRVRWQFILEELDSARQGNSEAQAFARQSGVPKHEYVDALDSSFPEVDGPDGPQQQLLQLCMNLTEDMSLLVKFRTSIVRHIMEDQALAA